MIKECPKEVLRAVKSYARAVKKVSRMADRRRPDPQIHFHAVEYLPDMETMLIHQLLTAIPIREQRMEVLESCGLSYLAGDMDLTEKDWEEAY
jgi:hypothetical protein